MATGARDKGWHVLQTRTACLAGEPTHVKLCSVSCPARPRYLCRALTMFDHAMHTTDCWYRVRVERLWVKDVGRHSLQSDLALGGTQRTIWRGKCLGPSARRWETTSYHNAPAGIAGRSVESGEDIPLRVIMAYDRRCGPVRRWWPPSTCVLNMHLDTTRASDRFGGLGSRLDGLPSFHSKR